LRISGEYKQHDAPRPDWIGGKGRGKADLSRRRESVQAKPALAARAKRDISKSANERLDD
jgi:hypothetical protein